MRVAGGPGIVGLPSGTAPGGGGAHGSRSRREGGRDLRRGERLPMSSESRGPIILACVAMVQHGVVLRLLDPILPDLMAEFGVGETVVGLMLALGSLGFTLGPPLAAAVTDRVGVRSALLGGVAVEVLVLTAFGWAPAFAWALVCSFLLRFGASHVEMAVNVIPALVARGRRTALMNRVHLVFGIGAMGSPLVAGLILRMSGSWRPVFWFGAVVTAMLLAWAAAIRLPPAPARAEGARPVPFRGLLADRGLLLGALTLFFYVGAEVGVSAWIVLYLKRRLALSTLSATTGLTILWFGIVAGRYLNSLLAERLGARRLVIGAGIGGLAAGLASVAAGTAPAGYAALAAFGVLVSGVFPNVMADLNGRDPQRAGAVTGVLTIAASAGAMVFQAVIGAVAEWLGIRAALLIPALLMGLVAASYAAATRTAGQADPAPGP